MAVMRSAEERATMVLQRAAKSRTKAGKGSVPDLLRRRRSSKDYSGEEDASLGELSLI
jgi:hypothetical protein